MICWVCGTTSSTLGRKSGFGFRVVGVGLSVSIYSRCCVRICSAMVGVPHRLLLPSYMKCHGRSSPSSPPTLTTHKGGRVLCGCKGSGFLVSGSIFGCRGWGLGFGAGVGGGGGCLADERFQSSGHGFRVAGFRRAGGVALPRLGLGSGFCVPGGGGG